MLAGKLWENNFLNMARRLYLPFAFFLCLTVTACQPKHRPIEGSVFIVKQNSENVKLGLVDVSFYNPQDIALTIEQAEKKAHEELESLRKNISSQEAQIDNLVQQREKEEKANQLLAEQHNSILIQLNSTHSRIAEGRGVKMGQDEEVQKVLAELEAIREEISRWNQDIPAQIVSLQARRDYLKKLEFAERSKMRPFQEKPPEFPEIGELEQQIKSLRHERKEKVESLTQAQQVTIVRLNRLEEKAKSSQKSASQALVDLEKEAASLQQKAEDVDKKIKETRAQILTQAEEITSLERDLVILRFRLKDFNREYEVLIFSSLPSPIVQAKTDADGEFRIMLPYRGNFCVAAQASRHITTDLEENYSWFFRVPPREEDQDKLFGFFYKPFGKPTADRVLLSNDNQIKSGFNDSLVSYPIKP